MENNLTKEENIILNMLLAKRDKNNSIKAVEQKKKKETKKEMNDRIFKSYEEYKAKRLQRMINKN